MAKIFKKNLTLVNFFTKVDKIGQTCMLWLSHLFLAGDLHNFGAIIMRSSEQKKRLIEFVASASTPFPISERFLCKHPTLVPSLPAPEMGTSDT